MGSCDCLRVVALRLISDSLLSEMDGRADTHVRTARVVCRGLPLLTGSVLRREQTREWRRAAGRPWEMGQTAHSTAINVVVVVVVHKLLQDGGNEKQVVSSDLQRHG